MPECRRVGPASGQALLSRWLHAALLGAGLGACGGGDGPVAVSGPGPATAVVIELPSPLLSVGEVRHASARVVDSLGNHVTTRFVTWSSENVSIATVDQDGGITAVGVGETRILATSAELVGEIKIRVVAARAASITVATPKHTITWNATTRVVADVRDRYGNQLAPTRVGWSSSWPEVISVDQEGVVTAHATGAAWIRALGDGAGDSLRIVSAPPGVSSVEFVTGWGKVLSAGRQAFPNVIARNAAGDVLPQFPTRLTSSDSAIIRPSDFILNATVPGTATISSVVGGIEVAVQMTVVNEPRVEQVMLTTATPVVAAGEPVIILMETRDGQGNLLHDRAKDVVIQDWPFGFPAHVRWNGDTLVFTSGVPGSFHVWREVENREDGVDITVHAVGNAAATCQRIAGAILLGDDGQYLGHLTGPADPRSIQNREGRYGSLFSSTSVFAWRSPYGMIPSPLSAMDPWAPRPPRVVKDGEEVGRLTLNPAFPERVGPALAQACAFP